jgi:hypothetical protein
MKYSQLLQKLAKLGIGQILRDLSGRYEIVRLAKTGDVCFPYVFASYRLILDNGPDTEIDDEIIDAILRKFDKTRTDLDPPN